VVSAPVSGRLPQKPHVADTRRDVDAGGSAGHVPFEDGLAALRMLSGVAENRTMMISGMATADRGAGAACKLPGSFTVSWKA
jgi:hypothetical protein